MVGEDGGRNPASYPIWLPYDYQYEVQLGGCSAQMAIDSVFQNTEHGGLKQFGQRLHLGEIGLAVGAEAMVDVIVNERALGGDHRFLHGLERHRDVGARPAFLDHVDDMPQMAVRRLEALDDSGMGCVSMWFCHKD